MRKNFYKRQSTNENRLQREISSLIRQYSRKATSGKYSGPYLEGILDTIERKKKLMSSFVYISKVLISEPDQLGRDHVVAAVNYGPVIRGEDKNGKVVYKASFDPPKNIRYRA